VREARYLTYAKTSEAVTGGRGIPIGYGTLVAVYLGVGGAVAWSLRRLSRAPLNLPSGTAPSAAKPTPSLSREAFHAR
jgi:hypothetical protein